MRDNVGAPRIFTAFALSYVMCIKCIWIKTVEIRIERDPGTERCTFVKVDFNKQTCLPVWLPLIVHTFMYSLQKKTERKEKHTKNYFSLWCRRVGGGGIIWGFRANIAPLFNCGVFLLVGGNVANIFVVNWFLQCYRCGSLIHNVFCYGHTSFGFANGVSEKLLVVDLLMYKVAITGFSHANLMWSFLLIVSIKW